MYQNYNQLIQTLPLEPETNFPANIIKLNEKLDRSYVVLDDDPTGNQTVHDVPVLTRWDEDTLISEFRNRTALFYILSNSRSMTEDSAIALNREIGINIRKASVKTGRKYCMISRSDSTLRGHYPAEVEAIAHSSEISGYRTVLIPAFFEGGRLTINNIHYVKEEDRLIPAAETPFAKDTAFGYQHSGLIDWVMEKSGGVVKREQIHSFSIAEIRQKDKTTVVSRIINSKPGDVFIVNAASYSDLEIVTEYLLEAEMEGVPMIYRTAASIIPVIAGMVRKPVLESLEISKGNGLIIVGSYVPKSTEQLKVLKEKGEILPVEISTKALLNDESRSLYIERKAKEVSAKIHDLDVVMYTSREFHKVPGADKNLSTGKLISDSLVEIVRKISSRPAWILAKGGITSSDIATHALQVKRAMVLGQISPGVPVWQLDKETRFPGMKYIVFPGNVGNANTLHEVVQKLKNNNHYTNYYE